MHDLACKHFLDLLYMFTVICCSCVMNSSYVVLYCFYLIVLSLALYINIKNDAKKGCVCVCV